MHRCVRCGNIYEDNDPSILRGCSGCGAVFFLYMKNQQDVQQLDAVEQELEKKDTTLEKELIKEIEKKKAEEVEELEEAPVEEEVEERPRKKAIKFRKTKFGIETIRVPKEGVYEINIDALMKKRPIIVFEKGKVYLIHLPQVFEKVRKR